MKPSRQAKIDHQRVMSRVCRSKWVSDEEPVNTKPRTEQSEELARQLEEFKKSGGVVKQVAYGVRSNSPY